MYPSSKLRVEIMIARKFGWVVLSTALVTGCLSNVNTQPAAPMTAEESAKYAEATPAQLIAGATTLIQKSHEADFAFFAPGTLKQLEEQLKEINALGKKPETAIAQLIAISRNMDRLYQAGVTNKSTAQSQLADVFDQKAMLEKLGAPRLYPSDYKDAVEDVVELVEYIEQGKPDKARSNTPSVMQDMLKLEIRIVNDNVLKRAAALLEEADDKDAKDIARKGYDEASLAYDRAVKFIDANPRDMEQINVLGKQATFLAQRSVRLAEEVARLKEIKPKDLEQVAVENEQRLQRIAEAMHHADVRDLTPTEQSVTLAKAAENLANEAEKQSGVDTEKLKAELMQAQESIKKLEASLAQADAEKKSLQAKLDEIAAQPARAAESSEIPKPLSEVKDAVPETALAVPEPATTVAPSAAP